MGWVTVRQIFGWLRLGLDHKIPGARGGTGRQQVTGLTFADEDQGDGNILFDVETAGVVNQFAPNGEGIGDA